MLRTCSGNYPILRTLNQLRMRDFYICVCGRHQFQITVSWSQIWPASLWAEIFWRAQGTPKMVKDIFDSNSELSNFFLPIVRKMYRSTILIRYYILLTLFLKFHNLAKLICHFPPHTERGVLSVTRFCYVFPCELRGPAWAVGNYSISQSAGGNFPKHYLQNLATDRTPRSVNRSYRLLK